MAAPMIGEERLEAVKVRSALGDALTKVRSTGVRLFFAWIASESFTRSGC